MSTFKKINYNSSDQLKFQHNVNEIEFVNETAPIVRDYFRFKKIPLQENELILLSAKEKTDADRAAGTGVVNIFGSAARVKVGEIYYYDLEDAVDPGHIELADPADFAFTSKLTIRFKAIFPYSGNPAFDNYLMTTGDSLIGGGIGSLISILHRSSDGKVVMLLNNLTGTGGGTISLGAFNPVAGQEYELEFNFNNDLFTGISCFLDGINSIGNSDYSQPVGLRDYFYIGTDRTKTLKSNFKFRDFNIFNVVKHIAEFPLEIPRIANLLPLESRVIPVEYSMAEGFFSLTENLTLFGGANVKYHLRINNSDYYINAGALEITDESFAQANTPAEWTASYLIVNALISTGERITFIPVASSGPTGNDNIEVESNVLEYDFIAFASFCIQCVLYGFVKDNCTDIVSGTAKIYTKKAILTQGNLISFERTIPLINPNGSFDISLIVPNLPVVDGRPDDYYYFDADWIDSNGKAWSIKNKKLLIPNQGKVNLADAIIV